eukprot:978094-Rhodomonas_salina.3
MIEKTAAFVRLPVSPLCAYAYLLACSGTACAYVLAALVLICACAATRSRRRKTLISRRPRSGPLATPSAAPLRPPPSSLKTLEPVLKTLLFKAKMMPRMLSMHFGGFGLIYGGSTAFNAVSTAVYRSIYAVSASTTIFGGSPAF